jgi:serine/threonine-protein kinase
VIVGIVAAAVILLYIIAFSQGRSVSFWPPKIGQRPSPSTSDRPTKATSVGTGEGGPIDARTILETASGQHVTIESGVYAGPTAALYRAKDVAGDWVMVKVFLVGLRPGSAAADLFRNEVRVAERLTHRSVVKVLDRGVHGAFPFIVMEYFGGGTLYDWLQTHDRLPGREILSIAGQVADAIDYAHSKGILHRDIKPENILFDSDPNGRIALSDFGIAQIFGAVEERLTASGENRIVGSVHYLAPEVVSRGINAISTESDIYSYAAVVFEMLAGRPPFGVEMSDFAVMSAKLNNDAPNVAEYRKGVGTDLAKRMALALSRVPEQRPKSARALLSGIEEQILRL